MAEAIIGGLLLIALLVYLMYKWTGPEPSCNCVKCGGETVPRFYILPHGITGTYFVCLRCGRVQ